MSSERLGPFSSHFRKPYRPEPEPEQAEMDVASGKAEDPGQIKTLVRDIVRILGYEVDPSILEAFVGQLTPIGASSIKEHRLPGEMVPQMSSLCIADERPPSVHKVDNDSSRRYVDPWSDDVERKIQCTGYHMVAQKRLLSIFYCNRCYDLMYPAYYQCDSGHAMCERCVGQLGPECIFGSHEKPHWRNPLLERVIDTQYFMCKYGLRGCNVEVRASDWYDHVNNCDYHPVSVCSKSEKDDNDECW